MPTDLPALLGEPVTVAIVRLTPTEYDIDWVGLRAQANFLAPPFKLAHKARAGQRAALSVQSSYSCDVAPRTTVRKQALP